MRNTSELVNSGYYSTELILKPEVAETAQLVQPYLDGLKEVPGVSVSETIIEGGNKMVVRIDTDTEIEARKKRVSLSIRKGTIGFMGSTNEFTRLSGEELKSSELVAKTIDAASLDPLIVDIPQALKLS